MDAISSYSFASCSWHLLQAAPLVLWPGAINGLLTMDAEASSFHGPSAVENYFARSLGLALATLGLVTVVLTGSLPLTSMVETPTDSPSPYTTPVLLLTALHHGSAAFYCWARYSGTAQTGYVLGFAGSAALASFGLWCLLFGGADGGHASRRTGADKRTSGFPFRNKEADKRKKGR
ncbi:hypothetical protein F5B20DRAFT_564988 [Whalleya microplaca]|nr:hypothetical protein F5B20DRAFT_564988 [Whalleya microplaca]